MGFVCAPYLYFMILITGSTGLVGRHLLLAIAQETQLVRALYRSEEKRKEVEAFFAFAKAKSALQYIDWQLGDLTDVPRLRQNFKGITHVYHCAALISFDPYKFKKLSKINIEGTANVVNLCLSEKVEKIVHLSSIATLSDLPNNPITEENHWDPDAENSVYALTKYGAEMEVWRATQEGLEALIFNPGIILGEGDLHSGSGTLWNYVLKEKTFYSTGSTGVIDVKDLINLLIQGMSEPITQERFIAVGHNVLYKSLIDQMATALQKKKPGRKMQAWWMSFLIAVDGLLGWFLRKRHLTKTGFKSLQEKKSYSNNKLKSALDFEPTPLSETIERVANYFKENQ